MALFGLFGTKAVATVGGEDQYEVDAEGNVVMTMHAPVKIGGQEFVPGDAQGYETWLAKAKANNTMIAVGNEGAHYPMSSPLAQAELIKAELQIKHGLTQGEAEQAVNALPQFKAAKAQAMAPTDGAIKAKASSAKVTDANNQFRGYGGPVGKAKAVKA